MCRAYITYIDPKIWPPEKRWLHFLHCGCMLDCMDAFSVPHMQCQDAQTRHFHTYNRSVARLCCAVRTVVRCVLSNVEKSMISIQDVFKLFISIEKLAVSSRVWRKQIYWQFHMELSAFTLTSSHVIFYAIVILDRLKINKISFILQFRFIFQQLNSAIEIKNVGAEYVSTQKFH